jgi:hypothetical protein
MACSGTALLLRRWEDGIRIDLGGCGLDSTGSGQGPVAGFCGCGDEHSGSCATELELLGETKFIFRISYMFPTMAVPWLRLLVSSLSLQTPGFAPGSVHAGFVVDKVALGQAFSDLRFSTMALNTHRLYHMSNEQ